MRVLLVGESAPDPDSAERRFFYAPVLHRFDNLFRGVVKALYRCTPGRAGDSKTPWLRRLRADGVFLIDLVPFPVDKLPPRERARARRDHVAACVQQARGLEPAGVVVCHSPTFRVLDVPMRTVGLPLLHEERIPFPVNNWRACFVERVRRALARMDG